MMICRHMGVQVATHEAMEQQTISVIKARVRATPIAPLPSSSPPIHFAGGAYPSDYDVQFRRIGRWLTVSLVVQV
jgi:hypothetical protein